MNKWERKLFGYLHDPPSKCLDIANHEEHARTLMTGAGLPKECIEQYVVDMLAAREEENLPQKSTRSSNKTFYQQADWAASAADRVPFPDSKKSGLRCKFEGVEAGFHHPLSGSVYKLANAFPTSDFAAGKVQVVQPDLKGLENIPEKDRAWANFLLQWRFLRRNTVEQDARFAFLPAETRLPDHTVWSHMQVTSAFVGTAESDEPEAKLNPALLKFQIGPVQDYIAAARSTRDLWSGSYLLSWLMAAGLKVIAEEIGPDTVIYPNLYGQPLFDLHFRDLWEQIQMGGKTAWESLNWHAEHLSVPNLPNVFQALVPANRGEQVARDVKNAIRKEYKDIAEACWKWLDERGVFDNSDLKLNKENLRARFDQQVEEFLQISWAITPWVQNLEDVLSIAGNYPDETAVGTSGQRLQAIVEMFDKQGDLKDRRYYDKEDAQKKLNNPAAAWGVMAALNSWQLDAVRQTRDFKGMTAGITAAKANNKDALNGREEAVAGGPEWAERWQQTFANEPAIARLFKHNDFVGASTLIKRVWHLAYLQPKGISSPKMADTRNIAAHDPFNDSAEEDESNDQKERYFAVLAFDGDEIGKWVSGENTPPYATQLADYQGEGSKVWFLKNNQDFLGKKRALTPSYHLQFSEALSNFALKCARPIVEAFDGILIYAGGDDLLALVPADTAVDCAVALKKAFRGESDLGSYLERTVKSIASFKTKRAYNYKNVAAEDGLFATPAEGFLGRKDNKDERNVDYTTNAPIPFVVPGPKATASVGVCIAHFKAPLQDCVGHAQEACKRAKAKPLDRAAIAVKLIKRSGEIVEWGSKFDSPHLDVLNRVTQAISEEKVSSKFPHRIIELLEPYVLSSTPLLRKASLPEFENTKAEILRLEFANVCHRQRGSKSSSDSAAEMMSYLQPVLTSEIPDLIGLFTTSAFLARNLSEAFKDKESK